jgi:cytochrome c oxidase assembly factor CtaG
MPAVEWNFAPSIVIGVVALVAAYLFAIRLLPHSTSASQPLKPARPAWFLLGSAVLFLALASPLDALSDDYLFSAHMIQHTLLTLVAPPLLLAGTPSWLVDFLVRNPAIKKAARLVTNPLVAFTLYNLGYSLWHLPAAYEAALENDTIHLVEHLSFIITATLFWWPILSPTISLPGLSYPRQILYLFLALIPCTVLGGVFIFAPEVIYRKYAAAPPFLAAIDPMTDQQVAGVIMAMAGMFVYLGFLGRAFYIWFNLDARQKAHPTQF